MKKSRFTESQIVGIVTESDAGHTGIARGKLSCVSSSRASPTRMPTSLHRTYREEVLNAYLLEDLDQVREISSQWLRVYNEEPTHSGRHCYGKPLGTRSSRVNTWLSTSNWIKHCRQQVQQACALKPVVR